MAAVVANIITTAAKVLTKSFPKTNHSTTLTQNH
jgi:hypothetical protein